MECFRESWGICTNGGDSVEEDCREPDPSQYLAEEGATSCIEGVPDHGQPGVRPHGRPRMDPCGRKSECAGLPITKTIAEDTLSMVR